MLCETKLKSLFLSGPCCTETSSMFPFFNLSFLCIKKYILFRYKERKFATVVFLVLKGEYTKIYLFIYIWCIQTSIKRIRSKKKTKKLTPRKKVYQIFVHGEACACIFSPDPFNGRNGQHISKDYIRFWKSSRTNVQIGTTESTPTWLSDE